MAPTLFKLVQEAEKSWCRIRGVERIDELLAGTVFRDGVSAPTDDTEQQRLAADQPMSAAPRKKARPEAP